MKIVVGLGNPWKKYDKTRHNIGFVALEKYIQAEGFGYFSYVNKFNAEVLETNIDGEKVMFVKPMTFMNNSGDSIIIITNFYKIEAKNILVVHDEIDFPVEKVKLKFGGGAAGHNGVLSLISRLGSKDFYRLRIGVDRPVLREQVVDYVLWRFSKMDLEKIENIWPVVFDKINTFLYLK